MFVVVLLAPAASAAPAPGTYTLSFNPDSVTGGASYIVIALVKDSAGASATGGTVVFQVCKVGSNVAIRPSSACADGGAGRWRTFDKRAVVGGLATTNAATYEVFSDIQHGWRIKYTGQGSGIANGFSAPADITVHST